MSSITRNILFTSESVSEGHPDKLCDLVSDAILDACLKEDPFSRVACECYVTTNHLIIGGEITTNANVDYEKVARQTLLAIGYTHKDYGIDGNTCQIDILIKKQSNDIAMGVNHGGAGDQGIMFGYACDETKEYMPLAITLAHELVSLATTKRKQNQFKYARPDMKSQVTVEYIDDQIKVDTIVMSIQHDGDYEKEVFENYIKENIIAQTIKKYNLNNDYKILINPTGRFVIGGPESDVGLTGRKIIVDTYGGASRHGGGAFSGKDATKVDRSAAYMARYIAKNIVAAKLAKRCEIQLSYAIGVAKPVSLLIDTFNTAIVDEALLFNAVIDLFNLEPLAIIETLNLRNPHYFSTAAYGHFGKNHLPWEKTDKVEQLKNYINEH